MGTDDVTLNLNETIAAAVKARVEVEVLKALSGDEVMGGFVALALQEIVEVKDPSTYNTRKVPFLTRTLEVAVQQATKAAVAKLIIEELPSIEDAVRKALKRNLGTIAATLSESLVKAAERPYGFDVDLSLRMPSA